MPEELRPLSIAARSPVSRRTPAEKLGFTTIFNLRAQSTYTSNLERSAAESLGIRFVHIPVGALAFAR